MLFIYNKADQTDLTRSQLKLLAHIVQEEFK